MLDLLLSYNFVCPSKEHMDAFNGLVFNLLYPFGFQEMMGLTYFMLDQSRKDAEYCMENAFHTYLVCKVFLSLYKLNLSGKLRQSTACSWLL